MSNTSIGNSNSLWEHIKIRRNLLSLFILFFILMRIIVFLIIFEYKNDMNHVLFDLFTNALNLSVTQVYCISIAMLYIMYYELRSLYILYHNQESNIKKLREFLNKQATVSVIIYLILLGYFFYSNCQGLVFVKRTLLFTIFSLLFGIAEFLMLIIKRSLLFVIQKEFSRRKLLVHTDVVDSSEEEKEQLIDNEKSN